MVKNCRLFFTFILISCVTCTTFLQDTKFVVDFIGRQNCSAKIIAVTDLSKDKLLIMAKIFSSNFMAITFLKHNRFLNNLELYEGKLTFLIDARCRHYKNVLNQVNDLNQKFGHQYFNESFDWIILENPDPNISILQSNLNYGINSKVFLVSIKGQEYKTDAVFKYSREDIDISTNDMGLWSVTDGFIYFNRLHIASNRSELNGLSLRVLYPFRYSQDLAHSYDYRQIENKNVLLNIILFDILCSYFNATHSQVFFDQPLDNTLIHMNATVLLHLTYGLGDIIGIPLTVVKERMANFRYLLPSSPSNKAFIFRAPTLAFNKNVYSMPFYKTSWYCLWGVLAVATMVLFLMDVVFKNLLPEVEIHLSLVDIIMVQISALFQKSSNWEFKSWSGRIATGFLYMTLMIITISYNASIVVYLQATAEDISDLKNLYESGIGLGTENISYIVLQDLMARRNDETEEILRKKIIDNYNNGNHTYIMPIEEGIKKVQTQFFAFYTFLETAYDVMAYTFDEYEKCSLRTAPGFYGERDKYLMIAKNSTFSDFYRIGFRKIIESGIQRREYLNHYHQKPKCANPGVSNFSGTGIVETRAVFLIFITGALLSFLLFFLEKICCYYRNSLHYYKHYNQCMKYSGGTVIQPYLD